MFEKLKDFFKTSDEFRYPEESAEDYIEIETGKEPTKRAKIQIRPFIIGDFNDIKSTLDVIREGTTIALLNIKPLKDKDIVELKRAIGKIKKTCEAIEGDIAGFGEDWIVVTPHFAQIYRGEQELPTKIE